MGDFRGIIVSFFHGIARSRVSLIGAMLTTLTFPFLLGLVIYDAWVHIRNPYLGAFVYKPSGSGLQGCKTDYLVF